MNRAWKLRFLQSYLVCLNIRVQEVKYDYAHMQTRGCDLETNLASRWEGVRLPRASGKSPDFPGSSPNFPGSFSVTSPEVLSLWNFTAIQGFPGSFPDFPGSFPDFPGSVPDFPGGQPLSLGSLTPSPDSQKLSLSDSRALSSTCWVAVGIRGWGAASCVSVNS